MTPEQAAALKAGDIIFASDLVHIPPRVVKARVKAVYGRDAEPLVTVHGSYGFSPRNVHATEGEALKAVTEQLQVRVDRAQLRLNVWSQTPTVEDISRYPKP